MSIQRRGSLRYGYTRNDTTYSVFEQFVQSAVIDQPASGLRSVTPALNVLCDLLRPIGVLAVAAQLSP